MFVKLIALISGGIDSPVAAYLMLSRGAELVAVHFDNQPFTDEHQRNKTIELVKHLEKRCKTRIRLYIVQHGPNQLAFAQNCAPRYECVLCRRMMFRVAERIAEKEQAQALITGESLGQVASQTLRNIRVETEAVKIPILRPLIGLDKIEIETIAKKIGTFEISTRPGLCCIIVPNKPATHANLKRVLEEEKKVNISKLVDETLKSVTTV